MRVVILSAAKDLSRFLCAVRGLCALCICPVNSCAPGSTLVVGYSYQR